MRDLIKSKSVTAVHDLSDGGLLIAALEMGLASKVGVELKNPTDLADHIFAFAEDQARYLVGVDEAAAHTLLARAAEAGVPAQVVGLATGTDLCFNGLCLSLSSLKTANEAWLPAYMANKG